MSDHVSKDIRDGYLTRDQGIDLVKEFDHIFPSRDLSRWLSYVDMAEDEFHEISERFRNQKIWKRNEKNMKWEKAEIWEE